MVVKIELKLKAKLDVDLPRKKIEEIATYVGEEEAVDFFYINDSGKVNEFRIRRYGNENEVVLKVPVYMDGIQKNEEYRFRMDDVGDFARFVEVFGYELAAIVKKKCEIYEKGKINVRVSNVEKLGSYVELTSECAGGCMDEDEKKREMLALLGEILGERMEGAIDNRYYGLVIKEMGGGNET